MGTCYLKGCRDLGWKGRGRRFIKLVLNGSVKLGGDEEVAIREIVRVGIEAENVRVRVKDKKGEEGVEGLGTWLRKGREEDEVEGRKGGGPEGRLRGAIKKAEEEGKEGTVMGLGMVYWMLRNGREPGRRCWDAVMEVMKIDGSGEAARRVVTGMEEYTESWEGKWAANNRNFGWVKPLRKDYRNLIHALGRSGDVDGALRVLKGMRSRHLPGITEYEAAIGACGRGRRAMDATMILMSTVPMNGLKPRRDTYEACIRACLNVRRTVKDGGGGGWGGWDGGWDRGEGEDEDEGGGEKEEEGGEGGEKIEVPELKTALDLLAEMKREGHRPLQITYRDFMKAAVVTEDWGLATRMFKEWYADLGPGERVRQDVVRGYLHCKVMEHGVWIIEGGTWPIEEVREEVEGVLGGRRGKKEETIRKEVLEGRNGMIREFIRKVEEGSMEEEEEEEEEEKEDDEEEVRGRGGGAIKQGQ
ncbi:hypothetical protein TrCOL_g11983 [Triparma columacea]|uniref:Pentacotripeptide-repeat region of PRORP domain-containing protein n=1 Tax=Triparma columacea TaxID=722753 RepID=A0A9W7G4U7_9STRA|nr:hypothetical protein TrCOL_g11983 [Triparma columacea]